MTLPLISALGFIEVLILMLVLVWLAGRYFRRHRKESAGGGQMRRESLVT